MGAQEIVGQDVGSASVCIGNGEARTTSAQNIFGSVGCAEGVVGVGLYRDELKYSRIRRILAVESDRKRSGSAVELTRVNGEIDMRIGPVKPVEATVQNLLLKPRVHDQVCTSGKIWRNYWADTRKFLPGVLGCPDFLLREQKP